ncbi:MAG: lipopolysaccharide biosynthesis protein, partial [Burkholderiales bacterium]|nr:lipopolysaccharide biosynthesis protein [Burkholderiales bacterium]
MNKIAERDVRNAENTRPVASPIPHEENLQSSFLDPDLSDLESGARLRGAILEHSGREISGWIVDTRSPT